MSEIEAYIEQEEGEEAMSRELVPAPQASVTLFKTDEPGEIIAKATRVADALSGVLKAKKLTKHISGKDHVLVEGWTLCGTMLGVYPVVKWTRELEDGWEARAVAVTQAGAIVGAAEAMCVRGETKWKNADEYAIRSMAQTRAISKALRLPLGFIVSLAGFSATPAEEIDAEEAQSKVQPKPESDDFDPGQHTHPDAITGERFLERLGENFKAIDANVAWREVLDEQLDRKQWEADGKAEEFWRRTANAVAKLGDLSAFPPPDDAAVQEAFAWAFDGIAIELVRPVEAELEEMDEAAAGAAEADDEADAPLKGEDVDAALAADDDVEFGEEVADEQGERAP